jgi:hypothetical protein
MTNSELPRLFIASSTEALPIAEAVNIRLESVARVKQWDNAFELSTLTLPALLARTEETDFAVFVFHRDDKTIIRGNAYSSVRDNVLFELGLFIGHLGIEHCFVLLPRSVEGDFRLPTDLAGLTVASYDDTVDDIVDAVTTSCAKIKQSIAKAKAKGAAPIAPPAGAEAGSARALESELWRARINLQRASEMYAALSSAVASHFFSVAKPATGTEIASWEQGAQGSYPNSPKIREHRTFYVDQDVILPSLYGAHSISVIVAPGVRVYGLEQRGHSVVYFMDGFRKLE